MSTSRTRQARRIETPHSPRTRPPACAGEPASELSADHVLKHLAVEGQFRDNRRLKQLEDENTKLKKRISGGSSPSYFFFQLK